jgi:hypothetical protein
VAGLIASGTWKGRRRPEPEPITYFNSSWTPQAVGRAGLYLGWLVDTNLLSSEWSRDEAAEAFRRREMSSTELFETWGEKIVSIMLNEDGNAFTRDYFASSDLFWEDCEELLSTPFRGEGEDDWQELEILSRRLDERFASWRDSADRSRGQSRTA